MQPHLPEPRPPHARPAPRPRTPRGAVLTTFGPYPARVEAVHDGDTVALSIDLGFDHLISAFDFDHRSRLSCRVFGINAPELSTEPGKVAARFAAMLLPLGSRVQVTSHGWDAYGGRFDGEITLEDGTDFATRMVESGNAVRKTYR